MDLLFNGFESSNEEQMRKEQNWIRNRRKRFYREMWGNAV